MELRLGSGPCCSAAVTEKSGDLSLHYRMERESLVARTEFQSKMKTKEKGIHNNSLTFIVGTFCVNIVL